MEMIGKILNALSQRKHLQPFFGNARSAPECTRQLSGNCSGHVRDPSQIGGKERRVAVTVPAEHRREGSLETLDHVSGSRDRTPIPAYRLPAQGATDAYDAQWRSIGKLPRPTFDRRGIIETARQVLVTKIDREIVVWALLRQQFMPTQLQEDFDADEGKRLDNRKYRRLILAINGSGKLGRWSAVAQGRIAVCGDMRTPCRVTGDLNLHVHGFLSHDHNRNIDLVALTKYTLEK